MRKRVCECEFECECKCECVCVCVCVCESVRTRAGKQDGEENEQLILIAIVGICDT